MPVNPTEHTLKDRRTLSVRIGSAKDAQELLDYLEDVSGETSYLSFGQGEFDMTLEEETAYLESSRLVANRIYLVGRVDGRIVGSVSYDGGRRPRTQHTGELGISVRKEYWGQGVGTVLMDLLIEWARANRTVTKLNLRVRVDNDRAIRLYESYAFEVEGTVRRDMLIDGVYHDHLLMGLIVEDSP